MRPALVLLIVLSLLLLSSASTSEIKAVKAPVLPSLYFVKTWGNVYDDVGRGVAAASTGDIYVTGYTNSTSCYSSCPPKSLVLLKYDANGNLSWRRSWSTGPSDSSSGYAVTVDASGKIYVTGQSAASLILLKFDPNGTIIWQKMWGIYSSGTGVAVDSSGDVYVTGAPGGLHFGGSDVLLMKIASNGSLIWGRVWGGVHDDYAAGVAVDAPGNAYVTGGSDTTGNGGGGPFLIKFDSTGNFQWQRLYNSTYYESTNAIAIDTFGYVYITGETGSAGCKYNCLPSPSRDVLVMEISPSGTLQWQTEWGFQPPGGALSGNGIAVDSAGYVYVTGKSIVDELFLIKLAPDGKLVSQQGLKTKHLGLYSASEALGLALDNQGNILVVGSVDGWKPYFLTHLSKSQYDPGLYTVSFTSYVASFDTLPTSPAMSPGSPLGSETWCCGYRDILLLDYLHFAKNYPFSCGLNVCSIFSSDGIDNMTYSGGALHFDGVGTDGTTGYANVTFPIGLAMPENVRSAHVFMNGVAVSGLQVSSNSTASSLFFNTTEQGVSAHFEVDLPSSVSAIPVPFFFALTGILVLVRIFLSMRTRRHFDRHFEF